MRIGKTLIVICALALSVQAQAELNWHADLQYSFGGEELVELDIEYWNGDIEEQDIKAGEGLVIAFGPRVDLGASKLDLLVTAGYKSNSIVAGDDSVSFDRFLLTGMLMYDFGPVQLGAGLTREMNIDLDVDDAGLTNTDFDDALGKVFALDFRVADNFLVGLRHTRIEYEPEGFSQFKIDGNNTGLALAYFF